MNEDFHDKVAGGLLAFVGICTAITVFYVFF